VELQLRRVQRMLEAKNVSLIFTAETKARLATIGYDPGFGARPMKRVIQKYVINPLSERLLAGTIVEGDVVEVRTDHRGMIEFERNPKATKTSGE
jgi:ATP-dependent Clp protease ATP-binding subunit ClpB